MLVKPTSSVKFDDQALDVYDIGGSRWLTLTQIVSALGTTRQAVNNIYHRNRREFGPELSGVIDIPTGTRGLQQTRVFSPRGAALLAMFTRSERAAAFRVWVLDVLEGKAEIEAKPTLVASQPFPVQVMNELKQCFAKAVGGRFIRYLNMDLSAREISQLTGWTADTIRRKRRAAEALGMCPVAPNLAKHQARASHLIPGARQKAKTSLTLVGGE